MAVSQKKQKSDARLDFRLHSEVKAVIEQAAAISGQSLSDFAGTALYRTAKEVLEKEQTTWLSNRDRDIFMAMLDSDTKPNDALKQAARRSKIRRD